MCHVVPKIIVNAGCKSIEKTYVECLGKQARKSSTEVGAKYGRKTPRSRTIGRMASTKRTIKIPSQAPKNKGFRLKRS